MKILEMVKKFNPYNIPIKENTVVYIDDLPFIYEGLSHDCEKLLFSRYSESTGIKEAMRGYSVNVTVDNLINGTKIVNESCEKIEFQGALAMEVYQYGTRYVEMNNILQLRVDERYLLVGYPQITEGQSSSKELIGDFIVEAIFKGSVSKYHENEFDIDIINKPKYRNETELIFDVLSADRILGQFNMKRPKNKNSIPDELKIFEKIKE